MAQHRAARRRRGTWPVQLWLPDTCTPEFAEEARRACEIVNAAADKRETMDWLERVGILDESE